MSLNDSLNIAATIWFFLAWIGYAKFAKKKAKTMHCLASVLHIYRQLWMVEMLKRPQRISDAALISSLERNTSFLASTSMLIIAGLITIMASTDEVYSALASLPFTRQSMSVWDLQFKLLLLLLIYVYSFFSLTWSLRQYGFCSILLGAAPAYDDTNQTAETRQSYAENTAKIIDQAGHSYNYGLRAYYFSLAILPWFFNTWLFIITVAIVVTVLYRREFHSRTLQALLYRREFHSRTLQALLREINTATPESNLAERLERNSIVRNNDLR